MLNKKFFSEFLYHLMDIFQLSKDQLSFTTHTQTYNFSTIFWTGQID